MSSQSPCKNRRIQGLRMKQLLQIGVLLGVGICLLYHLQQHPERKSDVEANKFSENVSEDINLGRKDLKRSVRTEDSEGGEENEMEHHSYEELNSDDENKLEGQEDAKLRNEGSEIANRGVETKEKNSEIRQGEDMVIKENEDGDHLRNNDGQKMEEVGNIQILGEKERKGEFELTDKKIEENLSNETAVETKNQEIKSDEGKDMDQAKNSTEDSSLFDGQAENRSNETSDGFGGVKDQQNKTDVNSTSNSISSENDASNGTILEHSEESKSSSELSDLDVSEKADQPQTDTNSETSPEKFSSQEKDQKPSATNNSIPSENDASNGTILEHSEESKSSSELSDLDASEKADQPQTDTNSETSPEKFSSQEKDQKPSATNNSIPSENDASNGTILEHSEESKSSSELSDLDASEKADQPQTDTNSETSPEKFSSQEKDQKPSATNNDSETSKPESHTDDIQDAHTEIETLPDSGNGNNSNQEANAK